MSHEARSFFIALLLVADDFGLVTLAPVFVGRRCFDKRPSEARLEKLIAELTAADLIRVYFAGPQEFPERYAFIARFRQTLRQMKARYPMPPLALFEDDDDAATKFTKYKDLFEKMPRTRTAAATQTPGTCSPELELESDLETKRNGNEGEPKASSKSAASTNETSPATGPLNAGRQPAATAATPFFDSESQPPSPAMLSVEQRAERLGVQRLADESRAHWIARVSMACAKGSAV